MKRNREETMNTERKTLGEVIKEYVVLILVAFCIATVVKIFILDSRIVPTTSMYPTVFANDRVLVNKFIYRFSDVERQDIIVFTPNDSIAEKKDLLKRVIGLPGDRVKIENGQVYINGAVLDESAYDQDIPRYTFGEVTVPEGCLFVMGDNRNHSTDSRDIQLGPIDTDYILGRAVLALWPSERFGAV